MVVGTLEGGRQIGRMTEGVLVIGTRFVGCSSNRMVVMVGRGRVERGMIVGRRIGADMRMRRTGADS